MIGKKTNKLNGHVGILSLHVQYGVLVNVLSYHFITITNKPINIYHFENHEHISHSIHHIKYNTPTRFFFVVV
jgi:hypothetical protein